MKCLFEIKKTQNFGNKKIILGYAPDLIDQNSFVFSPIFIDCKHQINYEIGSEEGVASLLAHALSPEIFHNIQDFDIGYMSAESNVGEEELEEVLEFINKDGFTLILTEDFLAHPQSNNILSLLTASSHIAGFSLLISPTALTPCQPIGESNGIYARIIHSNNYELRGSRQFALFAKLQHLQKITLNTQGLNTQATFILDESMRGVVALLSTPFPYPYYPYQKIEISK